MRKFLRGLSNGDFATNLVSGAANNLTWSVPVPKIVNGIPTLPAEFFREPEHKICHALNIPAPFGFSRPAIIPNFEFGSDGDVTLT